MYTKCSFIPSVSLKRVYQATFSLLEIVCIPAISIIFGQVYSFLKASVGNHFHLFSKASMIQLGSIFPSGVNCVSGRIRKRGLK